MEILLKIRRANRIPLSQNRTKNIQCPVSESNPAVNSGQRRKSLSLVRSFANGNDLPNMLSFNRHSLENARAASLRPALAARMELRCMTSQIPSSLLPVRNCDQHRIRDLGPKAAIKMPKYSLTSPNLILRRCLAGHPLYLDLV